jgi:predicted nucleotidyltransferase
MESLSSSLLQVIVTRIVDALRPEAIYLYGSHAYGIPHRDSDVDLLIVVDASSLPSHRRSVAVYRALRGLAVPVEAKVVTRQEFEKRSRWLSSIERVAHDKGRILYDARSN